MSNEEKFLTKEQVHKHFGTSVYLNGVEFDPYTIFQYKRWTVKTILDEQNLERRRVMIDFFGLKKFLAEGGAKVIQKDKYGEILELRLREKHNKDDDGDIRRYVRWINSTAEEKYAKLTKEEKAAQMITEDNRKIYLNEIPGDIETAEEATAMCAGWNGNEFVLKGLEQYMVDGKYSPQKES